MKLEELKEWLDHSRKLRDYERSPNSDPIWGPPPPYIEHEAQMRLFWNYLKSVETFLDGEKEKQGKELKDEQERTQKNLNELKEEVKGKIEAGCIPDFNYYEDMKDSIFDDEVNYSSWFEYRSEMVTGFTDTLRKSFFVSLYSFWETQLFPLCNSLKCYDDMPSQEKKKQNFGPLDAYPFLQKIGFNISKVPNNEKKNYWKLDGVLKDIDNYRIVRNCIVHNAGYPDEAKDEEKLREYIRDEPLLSLNEDESIQFCQEFCEKTLKTIGKYFDELLENLAKWNREQIAR